MFNFLHNNFPEISPKLVNEKLFTASTELTSCIELLIKEQRSLCHEVANSTLFATRLKQRLVIARRYFTALSRHKPQENKQIVVIAQTTVKTQKKYVIILSKFRKFCSVSCSLSSYVLLGSNLVKEQLLDLPELDLVQL